MSDTEAEALKAYHEAVEREESARDTLRDAINALDEAECASRSAHDALEAARKEATPPEVHDEFHGLYRSQARSA